MEVELTDIRTRPSHSGSRNVDSEAAIVALSATKSLSFDPKLSSKSWEGVETGPAPRTQSHPVEAPATATPALTPASRRKARIQFAVLCWTLFLAGWNDGTTGPLLHRIQTVYHVRASLLAATRRRQSMFAKTSLPKTRCGFGYSCFRLVCVYVCALTLRDRGAAARLQLYRAQFVRVCARTLKGRSSILR